MKRLISRKIRYAVVGLGHISQVAVLPAFANSKHSALAALISGDAKKQARLGRKYSVNRVYSYDQYEECLSQGIDAVYIGLPNHLHHEFTIRALKAGVHVLCEKPMAVTSRECQEMIEAAASNERKLMIAYRLHFELGNLETIETARRGKLGQLRFFTSNFAQQVVKDNIRLSESVANGGGPVYDMGVYCINAARGLFGAEPTLVQAVTASRDEPRFEKAEEMAAVTLTFPDERIASFIVSFGAADISRYMLVGTKGMITADPAYEYAAPIKLDINIGGKSRARTLPKRDQFAAEIDYFSECILKDKEPEPSGIEGLADVRVIEAIYESARDGKVVTLEPVPKMRRPGISQEIHRPAHGKPETINVASPSGEAA
jgi:predicted dehydrogenase